MTKCGHLWYNFSGSRPGVRWLRKKKEKVFASVVGTKMSKSLWDFQKFFSIPLTHSDLLVHCGYNFDTLFCKYFFCARVISWLDSVTRIRFMVFAKGFFLKRYPPRPVGSLRFPYLYFIITLSCYFVNTFFIFYFLLWPLVRFPFFYYVLSITHSVEFVNTFFNFRIKKFS